MVAFAASSPFARASTRQTLALTAFNRSLYSARFSASCLHFAPAFSAHVSFRLAGKVNAVGETPIRNLSWNSLMARQLRAHALLLIAVLASSGTALGSPADYVKWTDARQVGPFEIQATFKLAKHEKLFNELPDLQREITRTLGVRPATSPIYIFLFSNEDQYRAYVQKRFPQIPYRTALFVLDGKQPSVYTFEKADMDVDLRHECTHALLHGSLPDVPLWLDEGLAKYFEVPASQRAFDHPYFDDTKWKWSLRLGMVRPIESLEERQSLSELDASDYRNAWSWVHFMMHGPEAAHAVMVNNIALYQSGAAPPSKFSVQMAEAVPNPNDKLVQHFKHWQK